MLFCHRHFMETDIKKSPLRWKLLQNLQGKPLHQKKLLQNLQGKPSHQKKRKLPVNRQITVKSTPKRIQKTSLSVILPLTGPLPNYEEPEVKDIGTQSSKHSYWTMTIHFIILIVVKAHWFWNWESRNIQHRSKNWKRK